jgi:catecholate siderophore receptor
MSLDRGHSTHTFGAFFALAATAFATHLHAQAASGEPAPDAAETVVVTGRAGLDDAQKVDLSYAVTRISNESLRMDAPMGVADALQAVPGFWVESSGGEASANIRARGIPQEGFSAVGMQEDGLPIQHDAGLGWLNADQSFRLDETIDRIEVVRGGPASMFASNAPGGVVNFITRRPGNVAQGLLKAESSDFGLLRADGWYGGPVGDWRVGFGGFYRVDDGVRDPGYTANEGGQLRVAIGRDFEGGTIDFNVKRIDDSVIFYTGLPLTNDADGDVTGVPGVDARFGTLSGPDTEHVTLRTANGLFDLDVGRGTDVELTQLTARLTYDLPADWKLQNGLRYRESEASRIGLFPGTPVTAASRMADYNARARALVPGAVGAQLRYMSAPNEIFNVNSQNGNGLVVDGALRQVRTPLDELMNDIRVLKDFTIAGQRHGVALGAYVARVDETFQRYSANGLIDVRDNARLLNVVAVDANGNALGTITENGVTRYGTEFANGSGESTTYALYASDEWQITDAFRIDLGARWETVSTEGSVEQPVTLNLGGPTISDDALISGSGTFVPFDKSFDDWGWTAGFNWQFTPSSGVFARYTSTFRLPSVGSYITNATATPVTQEMEFIEAGYKFSRDRMTFYATAFNTQYDSFDFTEGRFDSTGALVTRTAYTDTKTIGLELEATYAPVEWFDIQLSSTLQDPEYGDFVTQVLQNGQQVTQDFTGNRLVRIPKVSYRVTPAVTFLGDRARVELDYEYYGDRFSEAANQVTLPSYDVVDLNASFGVSKQMTFYLHAENLLNEIGLTEGNPRAGQFVSGELGSPFYVGRPIYGRNYRFSAVWSF